MNDLTTEKVFNYLTQHVLVRYVVSGGTSAATDLIILYILNSVFGMHYLFATIIAYLFAFCVSFLLHKFWTFNSHEESTHKQVVMYLSSSLFGLGLNTILMYLFVEHFHITVILAQVVVGGTVAICTFFISRNLVFKYKRGDI